MMYIFLILKRFLCNTNQRQWEKYAKLIKIMVSLKKTMLALAQQIIEFMVITFWFQGIPWNHHKLYHASHISSWTPDLTYNFGINRNQNPAAAPQVFLWHKSKFIQVLISGNFIINSILRFTFYLEFPPTLFVGSEKCNFFLLVLESKILKL